MNTELISVLLLDDNGPVVDAYKNSIESDNRFVVTPETKGVRAYEIALSQLFDFVIIDAKLNYRGLEFGGIRLADDLRARYGANSIVVMSRYIDRATQLMNVSDTHDFVAKPDGTGESIGSMLREKMLHMRRRQFAFVAMPFSKQLTSLYKDFIVPAVEGAGFSCRRIDEVAHTRGIHELIFDLVKDSKLVVFVADRANANAYYEAGFADALKKAVVIVASDFDELKFDVKNRNTLFHKGRPEKFCTELTKRIMGLRHSLLPGR